MKIRVCFALLLVCLLSNAAVSYAASPDKTLFFDEENIIASIASFQDELYILTYDGVFKYEEESGELILITDRISANYEEENYVDKLCAEADGVYAVQFEQGYVLRILDINANLEMNVDFYYEVSEDAFALDCALTENYFCLAEQTGKGIQLKWINRETGKQNQTDIEGCFCVASYQGDTVLYAAAESSRGKTTYIVNTFNLSSGETTSLWSSETSIQDLYSGSDGTVYLFSDYKAYRLDETAQEQIEAATFLDGDIVETSAFSNDRIAVIVDNSLAIRSTEQTEEKVSLTFYEPTGRSADYRSYLEQHPDVNLIFAGNDAVSADEQFIQDMLTQSDEIDVYLLSNISTLDSIARKKMGFDLSSSASIKQIIADMYPAFAEVFSTRDGIWAVPFEIYIAIPGYNESFFERYDLSVPTTMMELLELAEQWMNEYAEDHPEAYFNPFAQGITLNFILLQYETECLLSSSEVSFENDELETTITKYREISELYQGASSGYCTEIYAFNTMDLPHNSRYKPLLLSLHEGVNPVISNAYLEMRYLVVNPYSKHINEAIEFVKSVCDAWNQTMQALLLQTMDTAVESPDYQTERQLLTEEIQTLEEAMRQCTPEERSTLQDRLDGLKEDLEILDLNQWIITEEEIQFYQELTPYMAFQTNDPLEMLGEQITQLHAQLQAGKIDGSAFLQTLDNRYTMILLEE